MTNKAEDDDEEHLFCLWFQRVQSTNTWSKAFGQDIMAIKFCAKESFDWLIISGNCEEGQDLGRGLTF